MGQKIHPLGFRLNITQTHRSLWFNKPNQYSSVLQEDYLIRNYLQEKLQDAGLSRVNLIRGTDRISIELHVGQPKIVTGENGVRLKELTEGIQKLIEKLKHRTIPIFRSLTVMECRMPSSNLIWDGSGTAKPNQLAEPTSNQNPVTSYPFKPSIHEEWVPPIVSLQIIQIAQPALDARLIAKKVAEQLEKRVAFRRVMKQSVQSAREAGIDGIKIQIAGRLNGAEIARTEWIREGRVPLHTLQADIDYCSLVAQTIYGTLGIKVWLFKK
jgi:small subunit ribosomal protein S3